MADETGVRAMKPLLWCAGFAVAASALGFAFDRALEAAQQPALAVDIGALASLAPTFETLTQRPPRPREVRVAFLGDSTAMHYADRPLGIDSRLEAALRPKLGPLLQPRVFSFAVLGATPYTYYFLADRVAATQPRLVVLSFNLHFFDEVSRQNDRPRLAGWLPLRRIGAALGLPLSWIGLDASELLLYTSLVRAGAIEPWLHLSQLQVRAFEQWRAAESTLDGLLFDPAGLDTRELHFLARSKANFLQGRPQRETASLARRRLEASLAGVPADHPQLEMLGAALDLFAARGIETLVYAVPVNVEHHEQLGVYEREALRPTLETVRQQVEAHGAGFLDLTTLLPDAAFLDGSGHLAVGDPIDAPPLVTERLARALVPGDARTAR